MASPPSAYNWECVACASFNKGGKYCHMCTTPHLKCQAFLAMLVTADVAAYAAVVAVLAAVAKAIPAVPMPRAVGSAPAAVAALPLAVAKMTGTDVGTPTPAGKKLKAPVGREAKASKKCALAMADVAAPAEVVAAPAPVKKVPGPFHPSGVVVEIVGTEMGDQSRSCEEHASNCGKVMAEDVVVRLWKVQIQVEVMDKMVITTYWVMDGVDCCHVGFLPCHMVRHATHYNGALAQVTHVFNADLTCCDTVECHAFH
jgi:hypothetical protein